MRYSTRPPTTLSGRCLSRRVMYGERLSTAALSPLAGSLCRVQRVYVELCGLVVVGLREAQSVASAVVYRVLSRLFEARDEELARGASPPPMSIGEAHYYFPQEGAREDFNKEVVEAVINKLTRLGRVRRMGVVFATTAPPTSTTW